MASYFHIRRNVHGKWPLWVQLTWVLGSVDIPPSLQMFFPWEISDISVNTTLIFRVSVALRSSNLATEIPPFHRLQMGYPPVPCFIIVFPINFARIWDYINYIHHFSDTPTSPTSYIYNNIYIYLSHDFKNILVIYQELFAVETPFHHPSPPGNAKKPPIHGSSHLINHRCRWMPGKAEGNFNSLGWAEFG